MEDRNDATVVRDALAGDREAFCALVRRYQDCAYGTAMAILLDFDLARDVAQEALLSAYRDLPKLRDPAQFGGWLRGIVRHTAYRALRELKRIRALSEEMRSVQERPAMTSSPAQDAENAEQRNLVRRALERTAPKNREALSLYYVDGLSYAEIGSFLGVTETAVQGRLQRGRRQLRKEFEMVKDTFRSHPLPNEFAEEVRGLLEVASVRGPEHERAIRSLSELGPSAVEPLLQALEDHRDPVRRAAARALCAIGDERALQPLLRLLYTDGSWYHHIFPGGQALKMPGVRQALIAAVRERKGVELGFQITALSFLAGDAEILELLWEVLRSKETYPADAREAAMNGLLRLAPESAQQIIGEALQGPELPRRVWWRIQDSGHLPPLDLLVQTVRRLECTVPARPRHDEGRVAAGYAEMILRHGDAGRRVLEEMLSAGTEMERFAAALALAPERHSGAFQVIVDEAQRQKHVHRRAKFLTPTLGRWYPERIRELLEKDPAGGRKADLFAWSLACSRTAQPKGVPDDLIANGTPAVRAAAVRMLVRERGAEAISELRRILREGRPRKPAQEAFHGMLRLSEQALPAAQEMLQSEHWPERKAAVCLLRRWRKLTPEQQAHAQQDPHIAVRHAALEDPDSSKPHPLYGRPVRR